MKLIRKSALLVLFFVLFTAMPWHCNVSATTTESVEVVLLFDVSGSMNQADPETDGTRLSIEAAHQFAFYYPTDANLFITVVPYNSKVYSGFPRVNVSTETGMETFGEQLTSIVENEISGFKCWKEDTDIGTALEVANDLLSKSVADRKSVILFTDGKIDLINDDITTEESEAKAASESAALKDAGIPIYSIGLNCNNGVDREQLNSISGEENVYIVNSAADLIGAFSKVYTFLFNVELDSVEESFDVSPDVATEKTYRIYGQAVKVANIGIASGAALYTIKVIDPDNITVADIDLRKPESAVIDESLCVIKHTPSGYIATIKLIAPKDGVWKVSVTGKKSAVITRKLYDPYTFRVSDNAPETAFVNETFGYTAQVYNENDVLLTTSGLFDSEEGAAAEAVVYNNSTGKAKVYKGVLNTAGNGYEFYFVFDAVGSYTIKTTISHSQFKAESQKIVTVEELVTEAEGVLDASAAFVEEEGCIYVFLKILDSEDNSELGYVPGNFEDVEFSIVAYRDGKEETSTTLSIDKFMSGFYGLAFMPEDSGKYTFRVSYELEGEEKSVTFGGIYYTAPVIEPEKPKTSEITKEGDIIDSIEESGFSGSFEKEIELDGVFEDSDGDDLTYEIKIDGDDDVFSAEYDEDSNSIIVEADGFGEATLIITVTDGEGAEYEYEIDLVSKSLWPIVIIIGSVVLVLLIALIIFLIIYNKKKVISISFNVKLETHDDGAYNSVSAVYNVSRLSNKKNAKGTMTLAQILNTNGYARQEIDSTMSEDQIKNFIAEYCHAVVLTGVPFKRQFKIEQKNLKTKKTVRKYVFKNSNIVVRLNENAEITFGNSHSQL